MEQQPASPPEREKLKSFDLMASVDMMQFDILTYGHVLQETRERVRDEELSSIAEGVNRAARTRFRLYRYDGELMYHDRGELRPYMSMLATGLEVAAAEQVVDSRKAFLYNWAVRDEAYGDRMNGLLPGQKLAWFNAYPRDVEARFGKRFLQNCGLFPNREMGFLYLATCHANGDVTLESQTVDRSDIDAFQAAMGTTAYDAEYDMDTLVRAYDGVLVKKHGGRFYTGRRNSEHGENAWEQLLIHGDLIAFFMDGLERLAYSDLPRYELQRATERHIIGVWKALKNRLDEGRPMLHGPQIAEQLLNYNAAAVYERLQRETNIAYERARSEGDIKVGCGGSIRPDGDPFAPIDGSSTFEAIFGREDKPESERYKFDKHMYCVVCQAPPKREERKKMCGPCGICQHCDGVLRAKAKGALALAA